MIESVKRWFKRWMAAAAPESFTAVQSARARAHSHRLIREWGLLELNHKLIDRYGPSVRSGPFAGMVLTAMPRKEHLGPFLLGTYESELHPWLERIVGGRFSHLLDVGAKFGYYAVGLARRMPGSPVVAFDTDRWARSATREMAGANRVPNVTPTGFCSPRWLDRHLLDGAFILSDCEGYERELFLSARTASLDTATLLIETHEDAAAGVATALRERFGRTHTVEAAVAGPRMPDAGLLEFLNPQEAEAAVREHRGPQEWLLFTPRSGNR